MFGYTLYVAKMYLIMVKNYHPSHHHHHHNHHTHHHLLLHIHLHL